MSLDRSYIDHNRQATQRIRDLVARLSDADLLHPVGPHWTVAIALAHFVFWDRRVEYVLDKTEADGKIFIPEIDTFVNDLCLPLWAAIPPRTAANLAVEASAHVDNRLESYPPELLEEICNYNKRWVVRALHRNEHLDEVAAALKS
jgi:hypothetical protein